MYTISVPASLRTENCIIYISFEIHSYLVDTFFLDRVTADPRNTVHEVAIDSERGHQYTWQCYLLHYHATLPFSIHQSSHPAIHLFLYFLYYLSYIESSGVWSLSQRSQGTRWGAPRAVCHPSQAVKFEMEFSRQCMPLDN